MLQQCGHLPNYLGNCWNCSKKNQKSKINGAYMAALPMAAALKLFLDSRCEYEH